MFLSYYDYFSIVDIVLVLAVIVFVVIGYTKGFLTKFISLANSLCGFVFSLLFCKRLSEGFTYNIWGDTLTEKFKANIMAKIPSKKRIIFDCRHAATSNFNKKHTLHLHFFLLH